MRLNDDNYALKTLKKKQRDLISENKRLSELDKKFMADRDGVKEVRLALEDVESTIHLIEVNFKF